MKTFSIILIFLFLAIILVMSVTYIAFDLESKKRNQNFEHYREKLISEASLIKIISGAEPKKYLINFGEINRKGGPLRKRVILENVGSWELVAIARPEPKAWLSACFVQVQGYRKDLLFIHRILYEEENKREINLILGEDFLLDIWVDPKPILVDGDHSGSVFIKSERDELLATIQVKFHRVTISKAEQEPQAAIPKQSKPLDQESQKQQEPSKPNLLERITTPIFSYISLHFHPSVKLLIILAGILILVVYRRFRSNGTENRFKDSEQPALI